MNLTLTEDHKILSPQLPEFFRNFSRSLLLAILFFQTPLQAEETKTIKLGILDPWRGQTAAMNTDFLRYDRMIPVYREHHLEPALMQTEPFVHGNRSEEEIYQLLKPFHVIALFNTYENSLKLTPELKALAPKVSAALLRYVRAGGGLLILPQGLRYPADDDIKYWNLIFAPLGVEILNEGVFDPARSFPGRDIEPDTYWYTENMQPHPITKDVQRLVLPLHPAGDWAGVSAIRYSPQWNVIVSGEQDAKSFDCGSDNMINLQKPGSYSSAPPIVAYRTVDQGRMACFPLANIHAGLNYNSPIWDNTVETRGNNAAGLPSFTLRLLLNAYGWLSEPALSNPELGGHVNPPYQAIQYNASVEWDSRQLNDQSEKGSRGIFGAVSSYAGGKGSVAEYVQAARTAGLQFIVFADPLEKLTPESLGNLKADCAQASADGSFYACPGVEFSDGLNNRWVAWGEKVVYPDKMFNGQYGSKEVYDQWDGQKVNHFGQYEMMCQYGQVALLDYKQLREHGAHAENLWWFFHYFPLVYRHGKLAADNYPDFLHGMNDLRWAGLASFTGIDSPDEVASAAQLCFTEYKNLDTARKLLNKRGAPLWGASEGHPFVSQGPAINQWESPNSQMDHHWQKTRGAQRARVKFTVSSPNGIADIVIHDGDRGIYRRFAGNGEKKVSREFEAVHDKQHYLALEVTDTKGNRALSWMMEIFCYKQGLIRCGDNMNTLGSTNLIWYPDRSEMMPAAKQFENGVNYTAIGWDTGGWLLPMPRTFGQDQITTAEYGKYPQFAEGLVGKILDVSLASHSIQIGRQTMKNLCESYGQKGRPGGGYYTVQRDLGPLKFFEREHTMYAAATRTDWYTTWDHRRVREGSEDYRGGIIWHEGKIRITQDVTLKGSVPIELIRMTCPFHVEKGWGDHVIVYEGNGPARIEKLTSEQKPLRFSGRIGAGGYASIMPTLVGYEGFLAPEGSDFAYEVSLPDRGLIIGLGKDGQQIKAGTEFTYRYAVGTFADTAVGNALLSDTVDALNFNSGKEGYPIAMKAGRYVKTPFFCTVKANNNEASFNIGPRELIIDTPFKIEGLEDNGCAAVYTSGRRWFDFVAVANGAAWFQQPITPALDVWAGNILVCKNKSIKVTVVVDGQAEGRKPFVEFHNPTEQAISTPVVSPANTPIFGGLKANVTIPAGDSVRFTIDGKQLEPINYN